MFYSFPLYVFLGLVQADGESLASQFVPRCYGVIQKIAVEEQWKFWNSLTKTWYNRQQNKPKTVPLSITSLLITV